MTTVTASLATTARRPARAGAWPRRIRALHLYLGVFFAPAIVFFALTGAAQVLGLHKTAAAYRAPPLLEQLGSIHKRQTFGPAPAMDKPAKPKGEEKDSHPAPRPGTLFLKAFALATAASLVLSTLTGLYMTFRARPDRGRLLLSAALGLALPIIAVLA